MRDFLRLLALSAATAAALPAAAQDAAQEGTETPAEQPAAEAPAAVPQPAAEAPEQQAPQPYVRDTFKDWQIICVPVGNNRDTCTMQQLLRDPDGNPVSQISIAPFPPAAAPRAAAVELAAPLETLLSGDVSVKVDDGEALRYRFSYCTPQACVARFALSTDDIANYKAGGEATVSIVPLMAPDQRAEITMSLSGFTAAYDAMMEMLVQ
ncbi:invasion associated locus B family protein [Rhodovulum adriaticum]|uniref:Invasion protein IalB n=1 Tax=Rhodovulum adriaticum TaxID=35804 RepID=A0A4R2NP16_RHOAD|nr:invasion associated locus B family protein [Rhodovulum adriaticum]MBK1634586.1 hypothetical protein [Rhodovulum adriaticum]TCP23044.1 invasion protein IalB [Rhodovulum adriaticum]